jgi:hypothetical protein
MSSSSLSTIRLAREPWSAWANPNSPLCPLEELPLLLSVGEYLPLSDHQLPAGPVVEQLQ